MAYTLTLVAMILLLVVYVALGLRTIKEHQQGLLSRFGRYHGILDPGLHLIVPFVDQVRKIDLREVFVVKRIEPGSPGRIKIGNDEWHARTNDRTVIGPGTPIRIVQAEGQVMVVTANTQPPPSRGRQQSR